MTDAELQRLMQELGYSNPGIEPSPIPSPAGGYNYPHEAVNVPAGTFPQASAFDLGFPPSSIGPQVPDNPFGPGTFNDQFQLPTNQLATNEGMFPGDMGYFPQDYPPDFSNVPFGSDTNVFFGDQPAPPNSADQAGYVGNSGVPVPEQPWGSNIDEAIGGSFRSSPTEFPTPSDNWPYTYNVGDPIYGVPDASSVAANGQPPADFNYPFYINEFPGGADAGSSAPGITYDDTGNAPTNAPAGPVTAPYGGGQTPVTGANSIVGQNPYSYGPPSAPGGPVTQGSQGMLDANGDIIPGTQLSMSDEAKRYNMQQFNDPRYTWHDALHPGQAMVKIMSDGTRVLVDAAGKIVSGGIQAGQDLYHNIMNDPRNTTPSDLVAAGYKEGQGTGSLFPGSVTGPTAGPFDVGAYGVGGEGGSFFHGDTLSNNQRIDPVTNQPIFDRGPSTMNPGGYNFPTHGATSVAGASAGGYGNYMTNAGALGSRSGALSPLNRQYLMRLMRGRYTTPQNYGQNVVQAPSPFPNTPSPVGGGNWNAFHAGQVQLGDILRANPAYYNSLTTAMPKAGQGPGVPGQRATRGLPPTLPT